MGKNNLQATTEGAIIVALAMALSYVPHSAGVSSIEFLYGIIPLVIYALRRGPRAGIIAGISWGLLDLILRGIGDGSVLNPWQGLLEYPVAFGLLGIAGYWSVQLRKHLSSWKQTFWIILTAGTVAIFAKYLVHFFAGAIFWGAYAPKGMNAWIYSLVVNGGSAIANILLLAVILLPLKNVIVKLVKA